MYEELLKQCRDCIDCLCGDCKYEHLQKPGNFVPCMNALLGEAADAIERLQYYNVFWQEAAKMAHAHVPQWSVIESRPMDEEERQYYSEHYGYDLTDDEAIIYCCQLPEDGEEVLVCDKWGHVWIDTFDNDPDYGIGFETNGDMDGIVAWMPKPKPYKPPKESETNG